MLSIRGAVFDLDGTVLDSMYVWEKVDRDFLMRRGIPVPEDYIRTVTPMSLADAANFTIQRFGLREAPWAIIAEWNDGAAQAYETEVGLKPFAQAYLRALKRRGVRLSVATALNEPLCSLTLKRNGIWDLFDAVTTIDEVSRGKRFPDIYLLAARKIELTPGECAVFEDIGDGVKGAKDGGFFVVGVRDSYSDHEADEIRQTADLYIESFEELLPRTRKHQVPLAKSIL